MSMRTCPAFHAWLNHRSYIKNLHQYLISFSKRSQPLVDINSETNAAEKEFEEKWNAGELTAWEDTKVNATQANGEAGIWCAACTQLPVLCNGAQLTSMTRSETLLEANCLRCPPVVQKAPQGRGQASCRRRRTDQPQWRPVHTDRHRQEICPAGICPILIPRY